MQSLQQGFNALEFSDFVSEFSAAPKGRSVLGKVRFSSRVSLSRLNGEVAPDVSRILKFCKFPSQSSFRAFNPQVGMDQLATPKAGPPQGLGGILNDGYELTEHVVVDENHSFEGNNDVIEKLITGFKTFKEGVFKQKPELYDKLRVGQEPKMMMITCADSRVCPTMLHGLEAGEAFIVRNVANLVPPCEGSGQHHGTSAAIEYAVTVLNVENIIVMGHSSCGGIKALMSRDDFSGDFIGSWVKIGMPAKKKTLSLLGNKPFEEQCSFCEQEAVNLSLANLLTFPFIQERLHSGRLQIYGMHYDFVAVCRFKIVKPDLYAAPSNIRHRWRNGQLYELQPSMSTFKNVKDRHTERRQD